MSTDGAAIHGAPRGEWARSHLVDLDEALAGLRTGGAPWVHLTALVHGWPVLSALVEARADPLPAQVVQDAVRAVLPPGALEACRSPGASTPATPVPGAPAVVVDARGSVEGLRRCLAAVAALQDPVAGVVVVDASAGGHGRGATLAAGARHVHLPGASAQRARARGLLEVGADVVLCVDADDEVQPGWARAMTACFADPLVAAATGLEVPAELDAPALAGLRSDRWVDGARRRTERRVVDGTHVAAARAEVTLTASLALRRDAVLAAGGPARDAGRTLRDLLGRGLRVVHEPRAMALHHRPDAAVPAPPPGPPARGRPPGEAVPAPHAARSVAAGHLRITADLPRVSVVVPSRGRAERLVRTLRDLDGQRYPSGRVELVVALDGDTDGSASALAALDLSAPLRHLLLETSSPGCGNGAGVARNHGAGSATGDVVVFADDDVSPVGQDWLLHHGERHRRAAGPQLVAAPCLPTDLQAPTWHAMRSRNWWCDLATAAAGGALPGFADVLTGNLSCHRSAFFDVGGFRPLPRREDWEFAHRAVQHGVHLVALPQAPVRHDADYEMATAFTDRRDEGRADAAWARADPSVAPLLPLASWYGLTPRKRRLLRVSALREPLARRASGRAVQAGLGALEGLGAQSWWSQAHHLVSEASYWSGVLEIIPDEVELLGMLDAPLPDSGLAVDLDDLVSTTPRQPPLRDEQVAVLRGGAPVGTARLSWGGVPWRWQRLARAVADRCGRPGAAWTVVGGL